MVDLIRHYINGCWVDSSFDEKIAVIEPASERTLAFIASGTEEDARRAVAAAKSAFQTFSATSVNERIALLERISKIYSERISAIAESISKEMGAPIKFAEEQQAAAGQMHIDQTVQALKELEFSYRRGNAVIYREPVGVCGLITPWNWPMNQIAAKVAPAIAAGCTTVLKPSEEAPFSARIWGEILHDAGVPAGVFNMINGLGSRVGSVLCSHPDIDMVSFTGSTNVGVEVASRAAKTVKRVAQELGGKSPNIILEDANLETAISHGVDTLMSNSGQSCDAPSRMLVHVSQFKKAVEIARAVANRIRVGDPSDPATEMGPVVSSRQFDRVQSYIQKGVDEGAMLVTGGVGRPEGFDVGYYVKPTVFADVENDMTIARDEIFGPVLAMIQYSSIEDAIRIANDTPYGLCSYISSDDPERAREVAKRIRAGWVCVNGAWPDEGVPFGGYKQSGNGREGGEYGLTDYTELKAVIG